MLDRMNAEPAEKVLADLEAKHGSVQRVVRPFWISWVQTPSLSEYTLHSPWWVSGHVPHPDGTRFNIVAAVMAANMDGAKCRILGAFDVVPMEIEWRFCDERPTGWSPFCERFPRAPWMRWPND